MCFSNHKKSFDILTTACTALKFSFSHLPVKALLTQAHSQLYILKSIVNAWEWGYTDVKLIVDPYDCTCTSPQFSQVMLILGKPCSGSVTTSSISQAGSTPSTTVTCTPPSWPHSAPFWPGSMLTPTSWGQRYSVCPLAGWLAGWLSLVPKPSQLFNMLHAEKWVTLKSWEGLGTRIGLLAGISGITCDLWQ